jgi:diguanylate cyclase (GGDEF)-like protein
LIISLGLLLLIIIGLIDYWIIAEISLSLFYLAPILLTTWFVSRNVGIIFSILSAITGLIAYSNSQYSLSSWLPYWNTIMRLGIFIIIAYLMTFLKLSYQREKELSRTDYLTGILNRRSFFELLEREVHRFYRYQRPLTLVYLDVDNFKAVNDQFGHQMGDRLLCAISDIINRQIRTTDIVARLGGDEFAILFPETDYSAAQVALNRLQNKLLSDLEAGSFSVSFSMGAITFLSIPASTDVMLELVDELMYEVKNNGKNNLKHEIFEFKVTEEE